MWVIKERQTVVYFFFFTSFVFFFFLSHSVIEVVDFLKSLKLDKYAKTFEENQIDGDILTAIIARNADGLLGELGVKKSTERLKIKVKFRGFCDSLSARSSKTE